MLDFSIYIYLVINILCSMIKSNINTIHLYFNLINNTIEMNKKDLFEQGYIQKQLNNNKNVSLKKLPLDIFPSGCEYFMKLHNFFYDEIQCILIL